MRRNVKTFVKKVWWVVVTASAIVGFIALVAWLSKMARDDFMDDCLKIKPQAECNMLWKLKGR